ncbi:MAG: hypothetical protein HYX47_12790 [Burkholderiales bacterium]|nr:hypothetical protein [Burkholderiales bacterium]
MTSITASLSTQSHGSTATSMRGPEPFQHLPLPAKCAIEYLDAQGYGNRSIARLNGYLEHYFRVYGLACDEHIRASCHHIAVCRFGLTGADAEGDTSMGWHTANK